MRPIRSIPRRVFLGASAAAAISCGGTRTGAFRFFTNGEAATVDAMCETLIPADRDPGAHGARVMNYIDIQLTRSFRKHQKLYRDGIAALDSASRARFGKPFPEIAPEGRAALLADFENAQKAFFDLILTHARQGFYGDPRHGGNYHMASWKMLGLPFPPVRGRMHYDESRGTV